MPPIREEPATAGMDAPETLGNSPAAAFPPSSSEVEVFRRELRVLLDEFEAQLGLAAHQGLDQAFDLSLGLRQRHACERALLRVHGGLLELSGHHLAQALEAADLGLLALERGREQLVA